MKKTGRPSHYSNKLADEILKRIMLGESISKICDSANMPHRVTVHNWIRNPKKYKAEYFTDKLAMAYEVRYDAWFDEMAEIADNADPLEVQKAKLRIDTRKWILARGAPKKYGTKLEVDNNHSGEIKINMVSYKEDE